MNIQEAAQRLLDGDLVVFPTETVYGLGALANNDNAVRRIFEVKGRPSQNPLILHIAKNNQLADLVKEISPAAQKLVDHFWPGPLTICFKKSEKVSDLVSAGLPTVCIRRPDHPVAQELLKKIGEAVAAPSANLSGRPSTTTFEDARKQLEQKGVFFLDGGKTLLGLESTVIDCSGNTVKLLRPGVVSQSDLEKVLGNTVEDMSNGTERITSPGQLLEHYAPSGDLLVLQGSRDQRRKWLAEKTFDASLTCVLGFIGSFEELFPGKTYSLCSSETDLEGYAAELYAFLNWCDRQGAKNITLELPESDDPLFATLLNRLEKASKGNILTL